jgi:hypothetical protein
LRGGLLTAAEMKYILAAIYTNFRTSVVDDAGIEQADAYTARPKGELLVLRFERVADCES